MRKRKGWYRGREVLTFKRTLRGIVLPAERA